MKFLKSTLAIVALLAIGAVNAKSLTKTAPVTTAPTRPQAGQPMGQVQPQPKPQQQRTVKTFAQLFNEVKSARNAWDSKTQLLSKTFVDNLVNDAIAADINKDDLELLLKAARDYHAQFTGPKEDAALLKELEEQRWQAMDKFDFELDKAYMGSSLAW
jgi:hypothetical protein